MGFNNFHGRLKQLFHVLTDDKIGSTPRFLPGSQVARQKDPEEMDVVVVEDQNSGDTPGTPRSGTSKRKGAPDDTTSSASKLRPRR
jgi:hypothetical protein